MSPAVFPAVVWATDIKIGEHVERQFLGITFNMDTLWTMLIAGVIVVGLGFWARRQLTRNTEDNVPTKLQLTWEFVINEVSNQVEDNLGRVNRTVVMLAVAEFFFILVGAVAAAGDVDQIDTLLGQPARDLRDLGDVEAALDPVGRADPDEQRPLLGPHRADRVDDVQQQLASAGEVASPRVGTPVGQRGEELVEQVAVGGVDLGDLEAGVERTTCGIGPQTRQGGQLVGQELSRRRPVGVPDRRRAHRLPTALLDRDVSATVPRRPRRGLPPGVGELDAGHGALPADEVDDACVVGGLLVVPDPRVLRRDATLRDDGGRLGHHQAGTALRERPEVDEVPVGGSAVLGGVLTHGRDPDAVAERRAAQRQRREEQAHMNAQPRRPVGCSDVRP
jgi:hypothetical protein